MKHPRPWAVAELSEGFVVEDANGNRVPLVADLQLTQVIVDAVNRTPNPVPHVCVVCSINPVCPEEGQDTCESCVRAT